MADPLGMAASIAGIISLADILFRNVYKYVRAARDAKSEIQTLADEVNTLSTLLRSLEALASDLEAEGDAFDPTLRNHYLNHCRATLDRVEKRVKKGIVSFSAKSSKLDGLVRQLKWPFSASETKEIMVELSRHKQTITAAMSADSIRKLQLCLSKVDDQAKSISDMAEVVKRIGITTQIAVDHEKEKILDYFIRVDPQPNLEMSIKLRHPMTGLWLTESPAFIQWLESPGSKLWLSGIPGAGKTVLAGAVVQDALSRSCAEPNVAVGFFFCDYKSPLTWDIANILGAVASQLARQKDEAFGVLQDYYHELHPQNGLKKNPDPSELRARIIKMSQLFDQVIIIVDGLDECGDNTDDVVEVLSELGEYTTGMSMALFSRDHDSIRGYLQADFEHLEIAAHTDDVRLYVKKKSWILSLAGLKECSAGWPVS
ncbi:Ankyrin repeat protein [Coniochaeta hoffmannii]|uniref:Ankyrin repeat protein n=1 Tax=Coniochaeta hoffmannii TaxID=91930 RepID=A0AA38R295_9PEZI|nr:Ankyrin repeat protein [Coniochaeta hoffmannii]